MNWITKLNNKIRLSINQKFNNSNHFLQFGISGTGFEKTAPID